MKTGQQIKVKWFDIKTQTIAINEYDDTVKKDGKMLLEIKTTYGILKDIFKDVIVIMTEEDSTEYDITTIPRSVIIEPKDLYS